MQCCVIWMIVSFIAVAHHQSVRSSTRVTPQPIFVFQNRWEYSLGKYLWKFFHFCKIKKKIEKLLKFIFGRVA